MVLDKVVDENRGIPLVSVIVPMYNEENAVGKVLKSLTLLEKKMPLEIIAVDDGSTDKTREVVRTFPSVTLVCHPKNLGKGKAIVTSLSKSRGQIVVIQDADLEYPPEEIPKLVKPIITGKADVVFGSRFLGQANNMGSTHRFGNRILSLASNLLFSTQLTDVMTGHKAFSRKCIDSIKLTEDGFGIEIEITAKILKNGWTCIELPIIYAYRTHGKAKIGYSDGVKCLVKLFKWRFVG